MHEQISRELSEPRPDRLTDKMERMVMEVSGQARELRVLGETGDARHQAALAALRGRLPGPGKIGRSKRGTSS